MDLWTYRAIDVTAPHELTGFDVEAIDGSIGEIGEASSEPGDSYIVVDTGFWIFGKKRIVPAAMIDRIDLNERKVYINQTKDEVKNAPDWDPDKRGADTFRNAVNAYYNRS